MPHLIFPEYKLPVPVEYTSWTLQPLEGLRMVNEHGSSVALYVEKGREVEVLEALLVQLQEQRGASPR